MLTVVWYTLIIDPKIATNRRIPNNHDAQIGRKYQSLIAQFAKNDTTFSFSLTHSCIFSRSKGIGTRIEPNGLCWSEARQVIFKSIIETFSDTRLERFFLYPCWLKIRPLVSPKMGENCSSSCQREKKRQLEESLILQPLTEDEREMIFLFGHFVKRLKEHLFLFSKPLNEENKQPETAFSWMTTRLIELRTASQLSLLEQRKDRLNCKLPPTVPRLNE